MPKNDSLKLETDLLYKAQNQERLFQYALLGTFNVASNVYEFDNKKGVGLLAEVRLKKKVSNLSLGISLDQYDGFSKPRIIYACLPQGKTLIVPEAGSPMDQVFISSISIRAGYHFLENQNFRPYAFGAMKRNKFRTDRALIDTTAPTLFPIILEPELKTDWEELIGVGVDLYIFRIFQLRGEYAYSIRASLANRKSGNTRFSMGFWF